MLPLSPQLGHRCRKWLPEAVSVRYGNSSWIINGARNVMAMVSEAGALTDEIVVSNLRKKLIRSK
jgi:hypothetical protein